VKRPAGFTLLELLIAVAVLGTVLVLLNQGVQFGLRATALQARVKERKGDLEAVDRAIRGLIAHADPGMFPEPASLRGTEDAVSLTTELPSPEGGEPRRVAATLLAADGQLRLRWVPLRHVQLFGPAPAAQEMALLEGVTGLRVAYFARGGSGWVPTWNGETLPALVSVQIVLAAERHWPPILTAPLLEPLEQ
jgi:general secretion pathway protein J